MLAGRSLPRQVRFKVLERIFPIKTRLSSYFDPKTYSANWRYGRRGGTDLVRFLIASGIGQFAKLAQVFNLGPASNPFQGLALAFEIRFRPFGITMRFEFANYARRLDAPAEALDDAQV